MRRFLKYLGISAASLALFFAAALVAYDVFVFLPIVKESRTLLAESDTEDINPPKLVSELVTESVGGQIMVSAFVTRSLRFRFDKLPAKHLNHLATQLLWWFLVEIHYTDDEVMSLYCSLSWNGYNYGVNALSQRMFEKPLSILNLEETATVVVALRGPSLAKKRDWLIEQRDALIEKYQSAT